jgi:hypothetical protein
MIRSITLSRAAAASAFAALFGVLIAFTTTAHAAPKLTDCTVSDSKGGDDTDTFTPKTAEIFASCDVDGAVAGTKITTKWIAIDSNGVAPPNYVIDTADVTLKGAEDVTDFSLSKPNSGFPVGTYRIDLFVNGDPAKSVKFSVEK